jgi:hypothetical protein
LSHYDDVLEELRHKGQKLANQYIVELYIILRDEEKLPPEDCRAKIEHDCLDLWSKATIMKYLPPEAKDTKKQKAGKMGGESKKDNKKKAMLLVAQNENGARINLAENDSDSHKEQESDTFHNELDYQLSRRIISPELFEANRIIATKDQRIRELKTELDNSKGYPVDNIAVLLLSHSLAIEIYNAIRNGMSSGVIIQFKLTHNGEEITAVYPANKS